MKLYVITMTCNNFVAERGSIDLVETNDPKGEVVYKTSSDGIYQQFSITSARRMYTRAAGSTHFVCMCVCVWRIIQEWSCCCLKHRIDVQ